MSAGAKPDQIEDTAAPLIEHLIELRQRLIWSALAFVIAMILAFAVAEPILRFLLGPIERTMRALGDPNPVMQYTAPQEYFFTLIRISFVGAIALSFPVIGYQLWRFVAPGLYRSEKQAFLPFLIASPVLFLLGAAFAHFVVTPLAMAFFLGFSDASSIVAAIIPDAPGAAAPPSQHGVDIVFQGKVNETLEISLKLIVAFGLCFQLPVLLVLMGKAGLITAEGLASVRRYAIVGILVLAAIATPPDVMSQLILFCAVYPLYEVSIHIIRYMEKRREAELRAQGLWVDDPVETTETDKTE